MGDAIEVLYIEDNEGDRQLMERLLCSHSKRCRIRFAHDGVQALEYLRRRGKYADAPRPDLIILDLNLPRLDGKEVLQELKADASLQSIPILVYTSSSTHADIEACYASHAASYVTKPSNLDDLENTLLYLEGFWMQTAVYPRNLSRDG